MPQFVFSKELTNDKMKSSLSEFNIAFETQWHSYFLFML